MQFRLEKVSANKALVKFNVVNSAEELCGTVSVPPNQVDDFLRHWQGTRAPAAKAAGRQMHLPSSDKATRGKQAIVSALKRGPRLSKQAILRGS